MNRKSWKLGLTIVRTFWRRRAARRTSIQSVKSSSQLLLSLTVAIQWVISRLYLFVYCCDIWYLLTLFSISGLSSMLPAYCVVRFDLIFNFFLYFNTDFFSRQSKFLLLKTLFYRTDKELTEFCSSQCNYIGLCGHPCPGTCKSCTQGIFHARCQVPIQLTMPCGHMYEKRKKI